MAQRNLVDPIHGWLYLRGANVATGVHQLIKEQSANGMEGPATRVPT